MNWKRPWDLEKFDNIYNKDERFFSILMKGLIAWLNTNISMYGRQINHFIISTGSSYMHVENNGYEFSWTEVSGEDTIYMEMPRCVMEIGEFSFPTESLSNPFSRGEYERLDYDTNTIRGYNAEIKRIPVELSVTLRYVLSNFNETMVLLQELVDKCIYQKFFKIVYLGQSIECGIEFPSSITPEINKIDFSSTETNQKIIQLDLKVTSNYPVINERTEIPNEKIISSYKFEHDTV